MHTVLNFHRKLLCADPVTREIVQILPEEFTRETLVLEVREPATVLRFVSLAGAVLEYGVPELAPAKGFPSGQVKFAEAPDGAVVVRAGGQFLRCAEAGGADMWATEAKGWEMFWVISLETLQHLIALCRYDWVVSGSGRMVRAAEIGLVDQLSLRFGGEIVPLTGPVVAEAEYGVNDAGLRVPLRGTLFREGWRHDGITLYNPAVVYAVFGGDADFLRQFEISIESLWRFGEYGGDVFVLSDQREAVLLPLVPEALRGRVRVVAMSGGDRLDSVGARLVIGDLPALKAHQPVLYTDLDIMFDAPLEGFFKKMLRAEKCSAQVEYFHDYSQSPALTVGGQLLAADPVVWREDVAEAHRCGFCAGIFALPGATKSGWVLRVTRLALEAHIAEHGRGGLTGYEQSMLNYSLRHLEMFDPEPVTSATRLSGDGAGLDLEGAIGFVHFWPAFEARVAEMRKYLERLKARAAQG